MNEFIESTSGVGNKIKLSICITTRNRDDYIGETLGSVISQSGDNVEIVILDGASTDNTTEVVLGYKEKFKNLVYHRAEKNCGVDRDMGTCVEMAHGEYCWLLSDDDWLKEGAIDFILNEIESKCEIYICNATRASAAMKPIRENFWLSQEVKNTIFNLHEPDGFIDYCNKANSIGALFSFWSTTIFKRQEWLKTGFLDDFDKSAYAMAATLLSFIKRKCRLSYVAQSLVLWRDNDFTFSHQDGLVKRFLLDFDGYLKLADQYLTDDLQMRKAFLQVMTREHPWYTIINVTSFMETDKQWKDFKSKMLKFGYNANTIEICHTLGRFNNFVAIAVTIKRKIVKNFWLQKVMKKLF